jgi:hypothetical protein
MRWVVSFTLRPLYSPENETQVHNGKETGWAARSVEMFSRRNKSLVPPGNRSTIPRLPVRCVAATVTYLLVPRPYHKKFRDVPAHAMKAHTEKPNNTSLLFLYLRAAWSWEVNLTPWLPTEQEAGWERNSVSTIWRSDTSVASAKI